MRRTFVSLLYSVPAMLLLKKYMLLSLLFELANRLRTKKKKNPTDNSLGIKKK